MSNKTDTIKTILADKQIFTVDLKEVKVITGKEEIEIKLTYTELGYLINCTQVYHGIGKGKDLKPFMLDTMEKLKNARNKIEDNLSRD